MASVRDIMIAGWPCTGPVEAFLVAFSRPTFPPFLLPKALNMYSHPHVPEKVEGGDGARGDPVLRRLCRYWPLS
jgi:hypothetical protein